MNKYNDLLVKFESRYKTFKAMSDDTSKVRAKQAKRAYLDLKRCMDNIEDEKPTISQRQFDHINGRLPPWCQSYKDHMDTDNLVEHVTVRKVQGGKHMSVKWLTPEAKAETVAKEVVNRAIGEVKQNSYVSELRIENERLKSQLEREYKKLSLYRNTLFKINFAQLFACSIIGFALGGIVTFLVAFA